MVSPAKDERALAVADNIKSGIKEERYYGEIY